MRKDRISSINEYRYMKYGQIAVGNEANLVIHKLINGYKQDELKKHYIKSYIKLLSKGVN